MIKIINYSQAFSLLYMNLSADILARMNRIEKEGYTERSICYAIWKAHDKLLRFKGDNRFWGILQNEVYKYAFKKNDPRWEEIKARKQKEQQKKDALENEKARQKEAARQAREERKKQELLKKQEFEKKKNYLYSKTGIKVTQSKNLCDFIYFIQGKSGGPIKIGITKDISSRLKSLQTGHPDELVLLAELPGSAEVEIAVHQMFSDCRLRGEWFTPTDKLLVFIKTIKRPLLQVVKNGRTVQR